MKTGTVSSAQLRAHNRWDARFHLTLAEISDKVDACKQNVEREYVLDFLRKLRLEHLYAVDVLARGSGTVRPARRDICEAYPYIAFVLVWRSLGDVTDRLAQELTDNKRYLDKLKALEPPVEGL